MRELTKSFFSFSLAGSLFTLKQMGNLLTPRDLDEDKHPASKAFDSATHALTDQFEETLSSTFRTLDNIQRGMVSLMFSLGLGRRREGRESASCVGRAPTRAL